MLLEHNFLNQLYKKKGLESWQGWYILCNLKCDKYFGSSDLTFSVTNKG